MKKIFLLIVIMGIISSCKSNLDEILTQNSWSVNKVVDLKTGNEEQTDQNQQKSWDFNRDNTYQYLNIFNGQEQSNHGEWDLNEYSLSIMSNHDTSNVLIEKITNEEMVWLVTGKDSIRIFLSSKAKKVNLPNLPNSAKPGTE